MLLTTIEVIPFGTWEDRYKIQEIYIANVGGNVHKANYYVWLDKDPTNKLFPRPEPDVIIKNFHRKEGATELLRQVLNKWYTKKNKEKRRANNGSIETNAQFTQRKKISNSSSSANKKRGRT